jgi:hypothetical protein
MKISKIVLEGERDCRLFLKMFKGPKRLKRPAREGEAEEAGGEGGILGDICEKN